MVYISHDVTLLCLLQCKGPLKIYCCTVNVILPNIYSLLQVITFLSTLTTSSTIKTQVSGGGDVLPGL